MAKKSDIVLPADPDDPEDFDVTAQAWEVSMKCRTIRMARIELGLSQEEFARRFRVPVGTLRDWEQARSTPPDFAVAYARVIAAMPDKVSEILGAA
ncbi:MAG: helix-turn-helix domain-containing protein [Rhizobiaceae bacterium]